MRLDAGLSRWTQVVHDLGGPWTWDLADRCPETLDGLVVMDTTAYVDGFNPPSIMKTAVGAMGGVMAFLMVNRRPARLRLPRCSSR
jgi:pimeloyl-ACP methyl ester carboxylesterase